jgi:hypothetical protein
MPKRATSSATSRRNLAIAIYVVSMVLPSYVTRESALGMPGIGLLLIGWIGIGNHIYAWLANPLIIFCFFGMKNKPTFCLYLSIAALVLSLDFMNVKSLGFDSSRDIAAGQVLSVGLGGAIWLLSIILTIFACATFFREKHLAQKIEHEDEQSS